MPSLGPGACGLLATSWSFSNCHFGLASSRNRHACAVQPCCMSPTVVLWSPPEVGKVCGSIRLAIPPTAGRIPLDGWAVLDMSSSTASEAYSLSSPPGKPVQYYLRVCALAHFASHPSRKAVFSASFTTLSWAHDLQEATDFTKRTCNPGLCTLTYPFLTRKRIFARGECAIRCQKEPGSGCRDCNVIRAHRYPAIPSSCPLLNCGLASTCTAKIA